MLLAKQKLEKNSCQIFSFLAQLEKFFLLYFIQIYHLISSFICMFYRIFFYYLLFSLSFPFFSAFSPQPHYRLANIAFHFIISEDQKAHRGDLPTTQAISWGLSTIIYSFLSHFSIRCSVPAFLWVFEFRRLVHTHEAGSGAQRPLTESSRS